MVSGYAPRSAFSFGRAFGVESRYSILWGLRFRPAAARVPLWDVQAIARTSHFESANAVDGDCLRGKSGLRMAAHGLTTPRRKARNSGTERMSRTLILRPGTGGLKGVAGVKTAKLCAEQDQIGKRWSTASVKLPGKIA